MARQNETGQPRTHLAPAELPDGLTTERAEELSRRFRAIWEVEPDQELDYGWGGYSAPLPPVA